MKLKRINFKDFIGIEEIDYNPSDINILEGPKGSGKSSVLEAIEKTISNNGRRTELVRHGKEQSVLFVETDEGLNIKRKFKADDKNYKYLRLTKDGEGIDSTESEIRKFLSGDIFRPLDFIDLDVPKQTKIILNMIEMDYSADEICEWFDEDKSELLSDINTDKHILQILKDIEAKFYNERQEVNREIKSLEAQIQGIESELPDNYEGEKWENEVLKDYYEKIKNAQEMNQKIEKAQSIIENFEDKMSAIESDTNSQISEVKVKYQQEKEDIKDLVQVNKDKISQREKEINEVDIELNQNLKNVDSWLEKEIEKLRKEAENKKKKEEEYAFTKKKTKEHEIQSYKEKIASKQSELNGLADKQQIEIDNIKKDMENKIEQQNKTVENAKAFLKSYGKQPNDINKLQEEADFVAEMQSYLRDWRRANEIRNGELAKKTNRSNHLTSIIEIARNKPTELIKSHKLPIDGISVDEEGRIRINGTLLDGLSDGEALEVAFKIALERMGTLRIICIDGFERLNESEQKKVIDLCKNNDVQGFFTKTVDTEDGKYHIKTINNDSGQVSLFEQ